MDSLVSIARELFEIVQDIPRPVVIAFTTTTVIGLLALVYLAIFVAAPIPRRPYASEKLYRTILPTGEVSEEIELPCWFDKWETRKNDARRKGVALEDLYHIEEAEVFMSVVVPAYNEEERLGGMLEEAVAFLQREYGDAHGEHVESANPSTSSLQQQKQEQGSNTTERRRKKGTDTQSSSKVGRGWEIILVSDGSKDKTVERALEFARDHQLSEYPAPVPGPRTPNPKQSTHIPHGSIRVVTLESNRGKGGAVTHGMRHVRGKYAVFADADGASKIDDLAKLVRDCQSVEDSLGRGVAIGSRAHLVGSEAVVKRSVLRNFLMHSFHLLLRLLTPPATSRIKDTQCGFKLFSRSTLPYIIPFMHSDGWIFDVEMLMLAESAKIPMVEVAIGWKEVLGSKLNVVWASLGMAWGLAVLRAAWATGVYQRG